MVEMKAITEAINDLIVELYPDDAVYVNLLPKDFKRPSTLIEFVSIERTDANCHTLAIKASFSLTCYTEVDGHYQSDTDRLSQRFNEVINLFACGYLKVGDRCLEVQAARGGVDFTESFIDLQFDYFDDRPDTGEIYPIAEVFKPNITLEE